MCGIVAVLSSESEARAGLMASALEVLRHRGPDGIVSAASGRALLGHARLAIVDVEGGRQPMLSEDARCALVCNGEIYNHQRLREELAATHHLGSRSDSEVILHLYEDQGSACVRELDGMFAFVVTNGDSFTAARDAFGIKPLYVGWNAATKELWFASEFKALLPHCNGFKAVPPGSYLTEDGDMQRWFIPRWAQDVGTRLLASPEELRHQLQASVVKRLMSDVPIGVFLSGGLDSSIVAALVSERLGPVDTFAVGLEGAPDLDAARCVARSLGTRHHECVYTRADVTDVLETVIYHLESYDPALIRSAVPCYLLSRLAADTVKVVLTGEGADELFGGYSYFADLEDAAQFHRECANLLLSLHSMNLQRVDRMTMAHGLEGRVPFLDTDFVAWSMGLDPRLKLWGKGTLEKALLREAFRGVLPAEIVGRRKLEFSAGSGIDALLAEHAESQVSDRDLVDAQTRFSVDPPGTKEEVLYRRVFEDFFPGRWPRANVQRWRPHLRTAARAMPVWSLGDVSDKERWS